MPIPCSQKKGDTAQNRFRTLRDQAFCFAATAPTCWLRLSANSRQPGPMAEHWRARARACSPLKDRKRLRNETRRANAYPRWTADKWGVPQSMSVIIIRPLDPSEWFAFREFRLGALKAAPGVFWASHDEAATLSEESWRATIKGPAHQTFGLFDDGRLIGIAGAFTWDGDPSGATALLAMSFIHPNYRRRGLSRMLYEARLAWIRKQPQLTRIIVSHRASNEASSRAIQRHGFVPTGHNSRTWPDGSTEDEINYELRISK